MKNHVPKLSQDNPTGCCPRFSPQEWDGKTFEFQDKPFVRMTTRSFFYVPLNLGKQMTETWGKIVQNKAQTDEFVALTHDMSPWAAEHFLAVKSEVKGLENTSLTGRFQAKVFEGPYKDAPKWIAAMGGGQVYLYYTTCPKCQKVYGKNYVVAFKQLD